MQLSIRNRLQATVETVTTGAAMATVHARLAGGGTITAAITSESAEELGLAPGLGVEVLVKATEVAVGLDPIGRVSIRNRLPGVVTGVEHGEAMTSVKVELADGNVLTAAITRESAQDLGLGPGTAVTALIKSTDVALAVA